MALRDRDEEVATAVEGAEKRWALNLRGLIQVIIGVGALSLVFVRSDPHGLLEAVKAVRLSYLPLAVFAAIAVIWLMAFRWGVILKVRHGGSTYRLFIYY